jgi:hypothetical protein
MRTIAALILAAATWTTVQVVTAPTNDAGVCREYANHTVVCAPAYSPSGASLTHMWEDGSAVYSDGTVFGGYSEAGRPVIELDDLAPAEADTQAAELAGEGWERIPGECNCWTQA